MPAIESVPQTVLVSLAVYLSWRLLRPFVVKTSLDNLPGPPSPSFVEGPWFLSIYLLQDGFIDALHVQELSLSYLDPSRGSIVIS